MLGFSYYSRGSGLLFSGSAVLVSSRASYGTVNPPDVQAPRHTPQFPRIRDTFLGSL